MLETTVVAELKSEVKKLLLLPVCSLYKTLPEPDASIE
jgi:hypothetical protein